MVSQSRLYFALLATVATMAFWLGMWSNSVSNYEKFTLPKPLRAVLNVKDSVSYPDLEGPISSFSTVSTRKKPPIITSKISHRKAKVKSKGTFGNKSPPSISKSLFSFASMRPGSKNNPFDYAKKLISYRLEHEMKSGESYFEFTPPKKLTKIPEIETKWKIAPQYKISDKLPVEYAHNILIATSWRSGSTFLGDLLNHYPGTFYAFEPIHYLSNKKRKENWSQSNPLHALKLLRDIYRCDFSNNVTGGYLKHAAKQENQFLLKHNSRVWKSCQTLLPSNVACFMPELLNRVCPVFPVRLIKTVRLRIPHLDDLLQDPDLSLKVIVLVRDPRGVMRSRNSMSWCESPVCNDVSKVCRDLNNDVNQAYKLAKQFPGRVLLLRYEDLSTYPYFVMDKVITFLGLPPQQHFIDTYIATHTGEVRENVTDHAKIPKADDGAYGTKRKSSEATAFKWAETMAKDKEWLNHIEDTCQEPMQTLGYARYHKGATHGDILVKNFEEVWPYQ